MKPTKEELDTKIRKRNLLILSNKILSAISFKEIKTWTDVYKFLGKNIIRDEPCTYKDVKTYLDLLSTEIGKPKTEQTPERTLGKPSEQTVKPSDEQPEQPKEQPKQPTPKDYGYTRSPNAHKLYVPYWYQKKVITELFDGILIHKLRGQLCLAGTGTGKTIIAGDLLRHLVDCKFADDKTYGVVKYLYITKSTIVEQTKRIFRDKFNLSIKDGVEVINIEALRSKVGMEYVEPIIRIVNGEEETEWRWRKMLQPVVVLLDESQGAKNVDSTQSQIIQSYAELPFPHTYSVFFSATPFQRVCEAKAFVLNCHFEDKDIEI